MRLPFVATLLLSLALIVGALSAAAVSAEESDGPSAGDTFRDCADCPEMVVVPAGEFMMGSPESNKERFLGWETPVHRVSVHQPFAIGKYEVTRRQYIEFVNSTGRKSDGCDYFDEVEREWKKDSVRDWRSPGYTQTTEDPVVCVSHEGAKAYTEWLSRKTGHAYRLPSEAEWEYVARADTLSTRYWGANADAACDYANVHDRTSVRVNKSEHTLHDCSDGYAQTSPVGRFKANAFGLHDILGNAAEWVEDCWNNNYAGAPSDTSVWAAGDCRLRVVRGGSWYTFPMFVRSSSRQTDNSEHRDFTLGFRIARTLPYSVNQPPNVTEALPSEPAISILPLDQWMRAARNANVRAGPGTSHYRLQALSSGEDVDVTGRTEDGQWYRIALAGGRVGYVFNNLLKEKRADPGADDSFRDCADCPEMVVVPAGEFMMGSPEDEYGRRSYEGSVHRVSVRQPFAIGKYEVTFAEWEACVVGGGCNDYRPDDEGMGRGRRPVINVNYEDAKAYTAWLSHETGHAYRLPSEAEWEYAARAGTKTRYHFGDSISLYQVNYCVVRPCGRGETAPVGSYPSNAFGLHDAHGNVFEWVEDCWNRRYAGAPSDTNVWATGDCRRRVMRGGSWDLPPLYARSAIRVGIVIENRYESYGFRIARMLQ